MEIFSALLLAASLSLPVVEVTEKPDFEKNMYPGRVTPIAKVDVIPQVSGEILEVLFENGAEVKEGDVLYRLDSIKYEAGVKNAESKLSECRANARYAELSYERHKNLLETRAVSLDAVDNALSQRDSSRAALAAAQAELVAAKDDLKHCTIVAPITGKIGSTAKTKGNYVTAGSQPLVTIVQTSPIRVKFSVSNREILDIIGKKPDITAEDASLSLTLANGSMYPGDDGKIEYTDNMSDELTDTLTVYALFDNKDKILVPGGVVSVEIASRKGVMRPAIPPTAVLQDTQGPYVWAIGADGRAERRTIARGDQSGDWMFVEKGLKVGDRIVADGAHKVRRGDTVKAAQ
jgi:membrane fusion protein (multidrug efflux system)